MEKTKLALFLIDDIKLNATVNKMWRATSVHYAPRTVILQEIYLSCPTKLEDF